MTSVRRTTTSRRDEFTTWRDEHDATRPVTARFARRSPLARRRLVTRRARTGARLSSSSAFGPVSLVAALARVTLPARRFVRVWAAVAFGAGPAACDRATIGRFASRSRASATSRLARLFCRSTSAPRPDTRPSGRAPRARHSRPPPRGVRVRVGGARFRPVLVPALARASHAEGALCAAGLGRADSDTMPGSVSPTQTRPSPRSRTSRRSACSPRTRTSTITT